MGRSLNLSMVSRKKLACEIKAKSVCVCGCVGVLMTMWCSGVGLMVNASVL